MGNQRGLKTLECHLQSAKSKTKQKTCQSTKVKIFSDNESREHSAAADLQYKKC
jgi:hypothetical protein